MAQTSQYLKSKIWRDIAYRYGGDVLVMILPETSLVTAMGRTEEIIEEMKTIQYKLEGNNSISTTVSIGVAVYPEQGKTGRDLLVTADAALYRAKSNGRNQIAVAE